MKLRDTLVPLTEADLVVLSWYAAWTPEVHRAHWMRRRAWPPGFRFMADLSAAGSRRDDSIEGAEAAMMAGPELHGDKAGSRTIARSRLPGLLAYRLIEGSMSQACRLTARGRAALKLNGRECPNLFESHAPEIFDDVSLAPVQGENAAIEPLDLESLVGRRSAHGDLLPDDERTWRLMLVEYRGGHHVSTAAMESGKARMCIVSSTGTNLSGSIRKHGRYVSLEITDATSRQRVVECSLSLEGLAELLVGNTDVPITISSFFLGDGMRYDRPSPPPISVHRRMQTRVEVETEAILRRLGDVEAKLRESKLGARALSEVVRDLEIAARDVRTHGAFAAVQAAEEMSSVAQSLAVVMNERLSAGDIAPLLLGEPANGLKVLDGEVQS